MNINIINLPDLSNYAECVSPVQLSSDLTVICLFKCANRSDYVLLDIYKDDISEETKIISGRKLTPDCLICQPSEEQDFNYYVNCVDIDGIDEDIISTNAHKFYLQFTENEYNPRLKKELKAYANNSI